MNELSSTVPAHLMHQATDVKPRNTMGKDDFLKLLMTQLQNQDPLNPKDHEQFATQLAQFSSLEQLSNIGKGIEKMHSGMNAEDRLQALGMIGKEVQASGSRAELLQGQDVSLKFLPDPEFRPVKAVVFDKGGQLVRELELAQIKPGDSAIRWDGRDQSGKTLPSGSYTFRVFGVGKSGQSKELNSELTGKVVGVEMDGKSPVLVINTDSGKTRIDMAKVTKVSIGGEESPPKGTAPNAEPGKSPQLKEAVTMDLKALMEKGEIDAGSEADESNPFSDRHGWNESMEASVMGRNRL